MPFISIIIPVYNIEDYIEDCLKSVLKQDLANIEIILVNDGSSDGSQEICEAYSRKYSHIQLINQQNGGLSDARNKGIEQAAGEYILFVDGDDLIAENTLGGLAQYTLDQDRPDVVLFDYVKYYQSQQRLEAVKRNVQPVVLRRQKGASILRFLLEKDRNFQWMVCQALYKRDLLLEHELFFQKGRLYEDALWTPETLMKAQSIDYFQQYIYVYRLEREGQITSSVHEKSLKDNIYIPVYWAEKLQEEEVEGRVKKLLMSNLITRYCYAVWFLRFISPDGRPEVIELLETHSSLLTYSSGSLQQTTRLLVKTIGVTAASSLFKTAISLKRKTRKS